MCKFFREGICSIYNDRENLGLKESCIDFNCHGIGPLFQETLRQESLSAVHAPDSCLADFV